MKLIPHEKTQKQQQSLRDAMNRLFDEALWDPMNAFSRLGSFSSELSTGNFLPQVDISEDEKNLKIEVDLPGYDPKNVKVDIEDGRLIIQGKTEQEQEDKQKNYYRRERSSGSFYREMALPNNIDPQKAQCNSKNGTLTIMIPKTESKNHKSLEIKEG